MKRSPATATIARQVEMIIRRLNSLSTLPAIAANFLTELSQPNYFDGGALADHRGRPRR